MNQISRTREKIEFTDAVRTESFICVGLAGQPGAGKTLSALRLARGLTGGEGIFVIDADNRRTLQYADRFTFKHSLIRTPFRPVRFMDHMHAAAAAGAKCIIIDPISNAWEGDGGYLDMVDDELDRMAGDDWAKRERVKFTARIKPKGEWKAMCRAIEQLECHLIMNFRAHPKVQLSKDAKGKMVVADPEWTPIAEARLGSFATINLMLKAGGQGRPDLDEVNTKLDVGAFAFIKNQEQIGEETGEALRAWARGEVVKPSRAKPVEPSSDPRSRAAKPLRIPTTAPSEPPTGQDAADPPAGDPPPNPDRPDDDSTLKEGALIYSDDPTDDKHILALRRFVGQLAAIKTMAEYDALVKAEAQQKYLASLSTSTRKHLYSAIAPRITEAYERASAHVAANLKS